MLVNTISFPDCVCLHAIHLYLFSCLLLTTAIKLITASFEAVISLQDFYLIMIKLFVSRSSHRRCFIKIDVLKNFEKFHRKTSLPESLIKLQARGLPLIKKETLEQVLSVNFVKFLKTPFLQNTSGRLLLCFFE